MTFFKNNIPTALAQDEEKGNLLQYRQGDILIAGLVPVHGRGNEICSDIQEDGIQAVEAINMVIDKVLAFPFSALFC